MQPHREQLCSDGKDGRNNGILCLAWLNPNQSGLPMLVVPMQESGSHLKIMENLELHSSSMQVESVMTAAY